MHPDIHSPALTLGIAGAGAMGRGIAQIAAQAGIRVLLFDLAPGAAAAAQQTIAATLSGLAAKGKIATEAAEAAAGRIEPAATLEAFAPCHVVIEAIVEKLEAKRQLFAALEGIVGEDCILASNTSSLSVTEIAASCKRPGRVAGYHFFNPVPLMKVVEVVDALLTEPWVGEALAALAQRIGHTPVRAKDTPGFIVNHAGRGYVTEALRLLGENVAGFHEIDRILREAAGFRMGPFELLDLTGLDVSHPVMESIYHQYYEEPRYRPSALAAQRLAAGVLGRKSGRGFYAYPDGKQQVMPALPAPNARPTKVWVSSARPSFAAAVRNLVCALGGNLDESQSPQDGALCVVTRARRRRHHLRRARRAGCRAHRRHRRPPRSRQAPHPDDHAAHLDRHARGGAWPLRRRRLAGLRHPRQRRLRRAARAGAHREHRLRHRPAGHRAAGGHRLRRHPRPRLPERPARAG